MTTVLVKGVRQISPAEQIDREADLLIKDGLVCQLDSRVNHPPPDKVIDASGHWILPSFVDLSHALREPGLEHKATIATECAAAAKGGFGALCCPPNTSPVNDSAAVTNFMLDQAALAGNISIHPVGAMTKGLRGEQLSEMFSLQEAGCVAVTNLRQPFKNLQVARRCLEYASSQKIKVIVCPQDANLASEGCVHEGAMASKLGLATIPVVAETLDVAKWIILAEETGAHLHFSQLSTGRAVDMVAKAKADGVQVTADVALANLCYTDQRLDGYDPMYHVEPPLRSEKDRLRLIEGVNDGTIDAICSHHQPHEQASKQAPFAETSVGMSQVELMWPQLFALVKESLLFLSRAIAAVTTGPARAMGLPMPGITPGKAANLVVLDITRKWRASKDDLLSAGKNTPLLGRELTGKPICTFYQGEIVYTELSEKLLA